MRYCWYRHPKTTSEVRANSDPDIRQMVRGARLPTKLPSAYDDMNRTVQRSWKVHRKSQYKGVLK